MGLSADQKEVIFRVSLLGLVAVMIIFAIAFFIMADGTSPVSFQFYFNEVDGVGFKVKGSLSLEDGNWTFGAE